MDESITRKSFMQGAAALAGVAGAGIFSGLANGAHADEGEGEQAWDEETDVLVCGFGGAGSACALEAADGGAKVLLIEKDVLPGGSMSRCGGGMAGAGTSMQKEAGIEDSADEFFDWIMLTTDGLCPEDIARVYADNSAANIDWLNDLSIEFNDAPLFVGEETTDDFRIGINRRGVQYTAFGLEESDVTPRSHWAVMKEGSTATNAGPELFYPLLLAVNANENIEVRYQTALVSLVTDATGAVIGAVIDENGTEKRVKALNGVMLATGGFPNNMEMRKNFCYDTYGRTSYMSPMCTGDGVRAAMAVGADLANTCQSYLFGEGAFYEATFNEEWEGVFPMWLADPEDPNKLVAEAPIIAETHGGVVINTDAQVLNVFGGVIPNLYAGGCDVGSNIFGAADHYPGCGSYVGFALCFGRIAGANLATNKA